MVFKTTSTAASSRGGFTLAELMVASGIASMCLTAFMSISYYGGRSFASMANYADLESRSRMVLDFMTREIRQATEVVSATPTQLTLQDAELGTITYTYDPNAHKLRRLSNGSTTDVLNECDSLSFAIFQRNPTTDFNVVPTANPSLCKLVQLNWKCSRTILGAKANTESVQSAKIVIRKQ